MRRKSTTVTGSLVSYVDSLAKKNSEALSFIPRPRLEQYAERGQIIIAKENDEPAGFLIFGRGETETRIYQACVQYDARRRQHGLDMVEELAGIATRASKECLRLWCASDLEANEFWRLAGFQKAGTREGGQRSAREHILWRRKLIGVDSSGW